MKPRIALCIATALLAGCTNHNNEIPSDFPPDVPIISGEVYRAEHTNFEDGPGFVVDVLTNLTCEEVFAFYDGVIGPRGNGDVSVETSCGDSPTRYVSIAVHLGREGTAGLNMEQYRQLRKLGRPDGSN